MLFYDKLQERCHELNIRVTPLVNELGISSGAIGRWKSGTLPNGETLLKLAARLNCSVDYLLGVTDQKEKPTPVSEDGQNEKVQRFMALVEGLTSDQQELLLSQLQAWNEQNQRQAPAALPSDEEKGPKSEH